MINLSDVALLKSLVGSGGSGGSGAGDAALEAHRNMDVLDHPDGSVTPEKLGGIVLNYPSIPYQKPNFDIGEIQIPILLNELYVHVSWLENCFNFYGQALSAEYSNYAYTAQLADYAQTASWSYDGSHANEAYYAMSAGSLDSGGYDWYCLDKMRRYMEENFGLSFY